MQAKTKSPWTRSFLSPMTRVLVRDEKAQRGHTMGDATWGNWPCEDGDSS